MQKTQRLCSCQESAESCVIHLPMCNFIWHHFQWCHAWNAQPCAEAPWDGAAAGGAEIRRCGNSLLEWCSDPAAFLTKGSFCTLIRVVLEQARVQKAGRWARQAHRQLSWLDIPVFSRSVPWCHSTSCHFQATGLQLLDKECLAKPLLWR